MMKKLWLIFCLTALVISCSGNRKVPDDFEQERQVFVGLGSFQTLSTVPGEEMTVMHASHRTLGFGTKVLVTNLENNRSVVVTISDREPLPKDQVVGLSYAAARQLNVDAGSVVKVRVEVLNE